MDYKYDYIADLVNKVRDGNDHAFAELYSVTFQSVYTYAKNYMRDLFLAEDVVQDVYTTAYKNLDKLKDPELFVAWLKRITFNTCYDHTQKQPEGISDLDASAIEQLSATDIGSDPEKLSVKNDEESRLKVAISNLSPSEREIIILRFYRKLTIDDIAKMTGLSRSTVKRRIKCALDDIRIDMDPGEVLA